MFSQLKIYLEKVFSGVLLLVCSVLSINAQLTGLPPDAIDTGLGGANAIMGTVLGPNGQRLETRIQIRLATMTKGDRSAFTDEKGNFALRGIPAGNYTLIIDKEKDFKAVNYQVDIIQLRGSPPQLLSVNIRLEYKPNAESKAAVVNAEFIGVPQKALDFYNKAIEIAKKGQYQEAIKELQMAVSEYPEFMFAFNEIGVQYLKLNDLDKADEAFQSALKIKPEAFSPLMNRGIILFMKKQFQEAETVFRKVVKINDKPAVVHYFLGQSLANLGKFDEAEKELLIAVETGGAEMKEAHRILGIIYSVKGDKKRAAAELKTYLKLVPNTPDAEQLRKVIAQFGSADEKPKPDK